MAFEDLIARMNLLLNEGVPHAEDAHELLEQIHVELNQLKAAGQPLPEDLVSLERRLEAEFTRPKSG